MQSKVTKAVILILFLSSVFVLLVIKNRQSSDNGATTPTVNKTSVKKLPKFLDLGSHSCIPCKMMLPILDTLREFHAEEIEVEFIDIMENRDAGKQYNIRSIPTQIIYDTAGVELFRHEGYWSRQEIEAKLVELGIDLKEIS